MDSQRKHHTILRLSKYLFRFRLLLPLALAMTIISNALALMGPLLSGYAVDAISPSMSPAQFKTVFTCAAWMVLFYTVSSILSYSLSAVMVIIGRKVVYQMRMEVFDRMLSLPVGYYDQHQTGDIISRISYDIDTINESLSHDLIQLFTTLITVTGALGMMLSISPRLVLVFAVTVPISILFAKYRASVTRPLFAARSASLGKLNGFCEEMVTGQKTIKAYCAEEEVIHRFAEKNHDAAESYYRAEFYSSITGPSVNFINNLSLSMISVFGAFLYIAGTLSLGQISSFILYSRKFSGPINEAATILGDFQSALAAANRVFQLLDEAPEPADKENALVLGQDAPVAGDVDLSHVSFGYKKDAPILKDLSLHAAPGSMIAVVGPTGAGKTTLINLLMRFYDTDSGTIRVDGLPIEAMTRKSLRNSYAMVLQDTWLFEGTVFENLAYGRPDAAVEDVMKAAKAGKIDSFIEQLPNGYDTVLREDGSNISKGQKQLLTIARAMLLDAGMLILDEATSNVDTRTEREIQAAMRRLMEHKTCFVIAHRLSTIQEADWILVIDHGQVAEQGTHDSLLKKQGLYYQMYQAQFQ